MLRNSQTRLLIIEVNIVNDLIMKDIKYNTVPFPIHNFYHKTLTAVDYQTMIAENSKVPIIN